VIEAAGGVVWRHGPEGGVEVLIVHRPRYGDWSLPKGKLDPGEEAVDAARREVAEETGLRCRVEQPLPAVEYVDHQGRPKRVRYWAMQVLDGDFAPNDEVDAMRWVPVDVAAEALSYAHDVTVVQALRRPG
jgi:8-oxo-dGTP pyrophosphatase MutT (NUDIX family)